MVNKRNKRCMCTSTVFYNVTRADSCGSTAPELVEEEAAVPLASSSSLFLPTAVDSSSEGGSGSGLSGAAVWVSAASRARRRSISAGSMLNHGGMGASLTLAARRKRRGRLSLCSPKVP